MPVAEVVRSESARGRVVESEHTHALADGTELFYRAWMPAGAAGKPATRALVLFHRGHEHSGRLGELARALVSDEAGGCAVFAWDQRGHGRSPGVRGDAPSFQGLVRDAEHFVRGVSERHGVRIEDVAVVGHSVGAVIAAAWVHDYAPPIRCMALVTPALRIKLYVPLAVPGLRVLRKVRPGAFIKSYVRSGMLTHDPVEAAAYDADPLIAKSISVNILLGLHDTATRLIADARAIRTPTLVLSAGSDWVVELGAQKKFFERLGSTQKKMEVYPGFHHAVLHEQGRERAIAAIKGFVEEQFAQQTHASGSGAERGAAIAQHDGAPELPGALTKLGYSITALALKTAGKMSRGIALGWASGFDSGRSLDHVYRNKAEGVTFIGRMMDRAYLDSPGWTGIRARKVNIEALLARAIRETRGEGRPVRILDLAAGPGRYVMDAIAREKAKAGGGEITAILRDRDEKGLAEGRAIAAQMGLTESVRHEAGDAFDPASIKSASPRPTVAIVSGLYELFPGNEMILRSLMALHETVEDGGWLIYTNQPWHPQLAFIANVLINRDGKPWIMRCRSQAEMDALAASAGFRKVAMETDEEGIFTVSLARRV